jgi:hypothetical protein
MFHNGEAPDDKRGFFAVSISNRKRYRAASTLDSKNYL